MKRFLLILLSVILCVSSCTLFTGCADRSKILKVYNLGEYMDESVLEGFEDWYYEETGESVTLQYKTYITNEDMYTEIYKKHADYDVVCSSDYILSRMLRNDLLLPIDREIVYGEEGESGVMEENIIRSVNDYENWNSRPDYTDEVRYSVPYMWGTFGIMYRRDLVVDEQGEPLFDWKNLTWDCLFKSGVYENRRYMKNSIRDAFSSASIVANTQALSDASNGFTDYNDQYKALLQSVLNDTSSENMRRVEDTLKHQKQYLFAYESDDGKDDMITSEPSGYYGLFWSCDAGYAMEDSTDLYYGVPVEGANVWVDSFVIPKFTQNEKAAQYFLKYLCQYDQAYLNRDYAGCSSPHIEVANDTKEIMQTAWDVVCGLEPEYDEEIAEDVEYYVEFFEGAEGKDFGEMFIDMLFPSQSVLDRCAVMKDSDKDASIEMAKMWIRIKAS
ncbi:MAG: extracellular solute-binding protein [Clostridia bacterium]|nr:extracellular solute-binding protein [Clostridia bacterium]